jgi:hypothetical protein
MSELSAARLPDLPIPERQGRVGTRGVGDKTLTFQLLE